MLDVLSAHFLLIFVGAIFESLLKVVFGLRKIRSELSVFDIKFISLKFNITLGCCGIDTTDSQDKFAIFFENSRVQDIDILRSCKFVYNRQILLCNVRTEVACDTALLWEVQLGVWFLYRENFSFDLRIEFINDLFVKSIFVLI